MLLHVLVMSHRWRYATRESPHTSMLTEVRPLSYAVIATLRTLTASTPVRHLPLCNGDHGWLPCNLSFACLPLALSWGSCATAARGAPGHRWCTKTWKFATDYRVACASHRAARCLEESIDMSDPKEELHEDH
jgi:hypothetical protein